MRLLNVNKLTLSYKKNGKVHSASINISNIKQMNINIGMTESLELV